MQALEASDAEVNEEKKLFSTLIELLNYEKIIFNGKKKICFYFAWMKLNLDISHSCILDLQMKPYRTDEYVHKLFYETSRFSAFNHQWVVKSRINNSQRDPHTVNERQITYQVSVFFCWILIKQTHIFHSTFISFQLILKTKTSSPLSIHFFALKGPFYDMKVKTHIYKHDFTDQENESDYFVLPLPDSSECNRLLASKAINFRLIMFLLSK